MFRFAGMVLLLWCCLPGPGAGQQPPVREVTASRLSSEIRLDGLLNEPVWQSAQPIGELVQREPRSGQPPSEPTEVRVAYDQDHLYIAIRCFDSDPRRLRSTQMRRDSVLLDDDHVQILLDTHYDRRNAYYFATNPAGDSQEFSPQIVWRKDQHLTTSFELQQYWVNVPEGAFRTRLALYRLDYAFNPNLSFANFLQYDTNSRNIGIQSRLRYMVKPGNELFMVINHAWQYTTFDRTERLQAILTNARVKLNYTFRF